jgi:hypothetical protein
MFNHYPSPRVSILQELFLYKKTRERLMILKTSFFYFLLVFLFIIASLRVRLKIVDGIICMKGDLRQSFFLSLSASADLVE